MFCPVGYRSAAELWHEYRQRRLPFVYLSATKAYGEHETSFMLFRGSPLDICEFLFLYSLSSVGFCLASPLGNIARVFIVFEDDRPSLFSVLTPDASAYFYAAAGLDKVIDSSLRRIEGSQFAPWQHELEELGSWVKTYPVFTVDELEINLADGFMIQHHTLPRYFIRPSYLIASDVVPWASDHANDPEIQPILQNYSGWSICINEATYQGEWQEYLNGRKPVLAGNTTNEKTARPGRPRLESAYAAFSTMGFDKGNLSWAQTRAKIRRDTGEDPSDKTLRNWRDENFKG